MDGRGTRREAPAGMAGARRGGVRRTLAAVAVLSMTTVGGVLAGTARPAAADSVSTYRTRGTYTVTVPAGTTRIDIRLLGAAGYSGDDVTAGPTVMSVGGAGGSGADGRMGFWLADTFVQPGDVLRVVVGAEGGGGSRGY